MGLLLPFFALLAIVLHVPRPSPPSAALRFVASSLLLFVPAFALGYLIMIAAWPWAAASLTNPIRAIFAFAHFDYPIKTLLAGEIYVMNDVPRWYVPAYLAIKLPFVMLCGAAFALLLVRKIAGHANRADTTYAREVLFIACTALLPVLGQVIWRGPAFNGLRQFLFVVPPLAVLAGIGFDAALRRLNGLALTAAGGAAVGLWLLWSGSQLVRLHPYEYVYFNSIVGGLPGAYQRYDTDYWVNVMHEAVADLEQLLDRERHPRGTEPYHVAVCGERLPFEREAAAHARLKWARDDDAADFFIAPTHMNCDAAVDGKVVVTITRLGVPIGVVKDRRSVTRPDIVFGR